MRRRSGYTLIELLVVVAVIGVLVAILMPVLSLVRERAQRTACLSNLKQLGTGFIAYASDEKNRGFFPHEDRDGLTAGTSMELGNYCWFDRIDAYMGTENLTRCKQCPAWDGYANVDATGMTDDKHSYKMNSKLEEGIDDNPKTGYVGTGWPSQPAVKKYYFYPSFRAKNAGNIVLIVDGRTDVAPLNAQTRAYIGSVDHQRHAGTTNFIFCDGSAKNVDGGGMGINKEPNGWLEEGGLTWSPW